MRILVIDGMGGGIGRAVIEHIRTVCPEAEITAAGTNTAATTVMLKAGADYGATGENAVIYNCGRADFIVGAIGIVFANSMHGEISPKMAMAVSESQAHKLLIPVDKCNATVIGLSDMPLQAYINEIGSKLKLYFRPEPRAVQNSSVL